MFNCKNVKTIFQREFKSYFDSPVAYVFLVAFLVLIGFLTFGVAMYYERRQANLMPQQLQWELSQLGKNSRVSGDGQQ